MCETSVHDSVHDAARHQLLPFAMLVEAVERTHVASLLPSLPPGQLMTRVFHRSISNGRTPMRTVLIIQPYVPAYRVPLFEQLQVALASVDIDLKIACSQVRGDQMKRRDASSVAFSQEVRTRSVGVGSITLRWKHVQEHVNSAELVISELASGALDNYLTALRPGTRFATWGHGYGATSRPNRIDAALENWQLRRSRHFFAYTDKGRTAALDAGLTPSQVTVLQNTVDTNALREAVEQVSARAVSQFRTRHQLEHRRWTCYIGGLDRSKRLDFLLAAGDAIHSAVPDFGLIIAGTGVQEDLIVQAAKERPWLAYIGRVGPDDMAVLASIAHLLLVPGRVGLIAVDSFALGLPIVTTRWPYHAPEFDYLTDNLNARVTDDNVGAFSAAVQALLRDPSAIDALRERCLAEAGRYDMAGLVERFSSGIQHALIN
jgi:glycosyltransferase involved in cell wall biosynthesis